MMRDIRLAIRALLRTPPVTATAVLIMALGMGWQRAGRLEIPVRAGRLFTDEASGVVVNEALVRRHFPAGTDPIGRVLDRGTVIAVVGDVRQRLRIAPEPEIYRSIVSVLRHE